MTLPQCVVLVVEDHPFQRRTMLQILANLGAGELMEAEDGERALEQMALRRPDIVICDLDMPGMDGVEFLRHVAERSLDTALVIVSGLDEPVLRAAETTARAYGLTVLGAVRKPLTARRLLEVVGLHRPEPGRAGGGAGAVEAWRAALEQGHATVRLMPRLDLLTGRAAGLQAGAWRLDRTGPADASGELVRTDAADTAAAVAVHVAGVACCALAELDAVAPALDATLVVPAAAMADLGLADALHTCAAEAGIDPRRLCVALPVEPAVSLDAAQLHVLTRLRMRGFRLGVDGFTAGVARLGDGQLSLAPDEVTLARDAVTGATTSPGRAEALEATVLALSAAGMRVVADGCDGPGDALLLAHAGCDRAQGAAVGAPSSAGQLARWAGTAR